MYTSEKYLKFDTKRTAQTQKALNGVMQTVNLVLIIIGSAGVAAYIALATFINPTPVWVNALLAFALPFAYGLVMFLTVKSANKNVILSGESIQSCFYSDRFVVSFLKDGMKISENTYSYGGITRCKTKYNHYLISVGYEKIPVCLDDMDEREKATLYAVTSHDKGGDVLPLNAYAAALAAAVVNQSQDNENGGENI